MSLCAGYFSRTRYDNCAYPDDLSTSTGTYEYTMNPDRIHNCNGCLTSFGPKSGLNGAGVSNLSGDVIAAAQDNVDIDTIMSNRNVPLSKCKRGKVNPVNLNKIKTTNVPICNDYLDMQHTKMSDPAMFYRGAPLNRFYDLNKDPQANIFYDFAVNTRLEAKDNFFPKMPMPLKNVTFNGDNKWNPASVLINDNNYDGGDNK